MTDATDRAVAAATDAIEGSRGETRFDNIKQQARAAVEAAAPHIAAAERERILATLRQLPGGALFSAADMRGLLERQP